MMRHQENSMFKKMILTLALTAISAQAFSATVSCSGTVRGRRIVATASGQIHNTRAGSGVVTLDGREISRFSGSEIKINWLLKSFRGTNNHGDSISAKLNNVGSGASTLRTLQVRAFGVSLNNVPMNCRIH